MALSYTSVSPRTLSPTKYAAAFHQNLRLLSLTALVPLLTFALTFEARLTNVNRLVTTFYTAVTLAFPVTFGLELVAATACRLATFLFWEKEVRAAARVF